MGGRAGRSMRSRNAGSMLDALSSCTRRCELEREQAGWLLLGVMMVMQTWIDGR